MIYRQLAQRPRPGRRQLRVYITEQLLSAPQSTASLSSILDRHIDDIREELLILRHNCVVERIAVLYPDEDAPLKAGLYHWNCIWDLTEHGRCHMDELDFFQCTGCALRRYLTDRHRR